MLSSLVGAKLAIAAVAGSLSIGGVAAAAVTGSLPFEHPKGTVSASDDQGASESPDPTESADPTASGAPTAGLTGGPVGPDATGPAAFGLCHAFGGDKAIRKAGNPSVANRNLITAATAAGQSVQDYCAVILGTPTTSPTPASTDPATATTSDHGHGHSKGDTHGSSHGHGRP